MKRHLLALVSVASVTALVSAQGGSDREREGLVGRVSAVRSEYVRVIGAGRGAQPDGPPTPLGSVSYDAAGNYAVREVIDDYGFPVGKETFSYTRGRLTGSRLVDPKGRVLESRAYAYGSGASYEKVTITEPSGRGRAPSRLSLRRRPHLGA